MIHVTPQPEPADFAAKVAIPGQQWLNGQGWYDASLPEDAPQTVPEKTKWKTDWTKVGKELYDAYHGVCAYLGIRFEYVTGVSSVDHFLPKSLYPGLAYRWQNYRLSCLGANRRKGVRTDIMDPFEIQDGWFDVEPYTGAISPHKSLSPERQAAVRNTITELVLDEEDCRAMRRKRLAHYFKKEISESYFKQESPFLWSVLQRRGLL